MKCYLFVLPSGDMLLMNGLAALLARAASEMTMRIAPPTLPPNRPQCISLYDTVWVAALRDYLYSSKLLYRAEAITQTQNETHTTNMSDVTLVCMYTIGTCILPLQVWPLQILYYLKQTICRGQTCSGSMHVPMVYTY